MTERTTERELRLSEDEAMGLLDIVMLSPGELTAEQRTAVLKLSEFCRQFLRDRADSVPALSRTGLPTRTAPFAA